MHHKKKITAKTLFSLKENKQEKRKKGHRKVQTENTKKMNRHHCKYINNHNIHKLIKIAK